MVTSERISRIAGEAGWDTGPVERMLRMLQLLDAISRHPDLRSSLALKGGTALNAFEWSFARLSVDLDFNFVAAPAREAMLAARPTIERALTEVALTVGLSPRRVRDDHGGSKWRFGYRAVTGGNGNVEVDVSYLSRIPLFPTVVRSAEPFGGELSLAGVCLLALPEIAAGTLSALLDRTRARDVYDADRLLSDVSIDRGALRLALVVSIAAARRPWRELLATPVRLESAEANRMLVPMLRLGERPSDAARWAERLCARVEAALAPLRNPSSDEVAFLDAVAQQGVIDPGLLGLAPDGLVAANIAASPVLHWKIAHVRRHLRLPDGGAQS